MIILQNSYELNNFFFFYSILGIIYDVIVEPPSVGSTTDEHGHTRPVSSNIFKTHNY